MTPTNPAAKAAVPGTAVYTPPALALPTGGGALRSMGEKFAANPVTGTGSFSIPLAASPGRANFTPQLALNYDSGAGNGPFGFGWSLHLPQISRKTEQGLPRYLDDLEADVFVLSGAEDLAPVLDAAGNRHEDRTSQPGYVIRRYRPRLEGLFARLECWTEIASGQVHWRSISQTNQTTLYGASENSRITDPADSNRIFAWLICASYDDKGNATLYEYKPEDSTGIDLDQAHEQGRSTLSRSANRYLKRIRYGNRTPYRPAARSGYPALPPPAEWLFELVLDYGEHALLQPTPVEIQPWACRPDPFSTYRPGFEVRTYRLCQRVLMFHHFPDEPGVGKDCLVSATEFTYRAELDPQDGRNPVYSFLLAASQGGYTRQPDGSYRSQALPPLEFTYSQAAISASLHELDRASLENLPAGLDENHMVWLDLDGEGINGCLTRQMGGWYYKRNLSPLAANGAGKAQLGALELVPGLPVTLADPTQPVQFLDLSGDGQLDAVQMGAGLAGFYERTPEATWAEFRPFAAMPQLDWADPDLRLVDLTGDGQAEILITTGEAFIWHASLGEAGYGAAERVYPPLDETTGARLSFSGANEALFLADLVGDGLVDLVRIRNGEVCYWPNLGYGRFGAKVTMDGSPWFAPADLFDARRLRPVDIDGSGAVDLLYLGADGVQVYFNQAGNRWSAAQIITGFPALDDLAAVQALDLLGNGTACLVWSSPAPGEGNRQVRYLELLAEGKPHLLTKAANNLGVETTIQYAPSTRFYLADRLNGVPWRTRLPFPVQVVERLETIDRVSGNRYTTRYAYHHGYFDGSEREFRGFGMVEQWDSESYAPLDLTQASAATNQAAAVQIPPVYTKSWFHTGAFLERQAISNYFAGLLDSADQGEYYREPGATDEQARLLLLEDTHLPAGLTAEETRQACRALKGVLLRQEVYALDGSPQEIHPYTVTEQNYTIRLVQAQGNQRHAVFLTHARETLTYHYERNPAEPRTTHNLTLSVDDYGNVLESVTVAYGRSQPAANLETATERLQEIQAKNQLMYVHTRLTNPVDLPDDYRTPQPAEHSTYELSGVSLAAGARHFGFDELRAACLAAEPAPFEAPPGAGQLQKRLVEQVRTRYRSDDCGAAAGDNLALLPLGQVEALALPGEAYRLGLTAGLVTAVYGERLTNEMLAAAGYVHLEGDSDWWLPSGRVFVSPGAADSAQVEQAYAGEHFFMPRRFRDALHRADFDTESRIDYDAYDLLLTARQDALGNLIRAENDYRVLQASRLTDPNGNRSAVAFDSLGNVVGTAAQGKAGENLGDDLTGFISDLDAAEVAAYLADPLAHGAQLLGAAGTRLVYDLWAYWRTRQDAQPAPVVIATLAREQHAADLTSDQTSPIQHSFEYYDGLGRIIQSKAQAEAGAVPQRDPLSGALVLEDGWLVMTAEAHSPRWVGSGWTIYNNKGKPARQYEPFFSDTHGCDFEARIGVAAWRFYDPLGREIGRLNPDHTWQKTNLAAWSQETWDANDTVLVEDPRQDITLGAALARLPETEILPTWYAARSGGDLGEAAQAAAERSAQHAATPTTTHFDAQGRTVLAVQHNRWQAGELSEEAFYATETVLDIQGNQRQVLDAKGRVVVQYAYDLSGNLIHSVSMDSGERWLLGNVTGKPARAWDSRGHALRTEYDPLGRPLAQYVTGTDAQHSDPRTVGREVLFQKTEYGESQSAAESRNLRSRVYCVYDSSGALTHSQYDFKGNLLAGSRQLAEAPGDLPDWNGSVALEARLYTSATAYDALNRPVSLTAPDGSEISLSYNEANLLEGIWARLRGAAEWSEFVRDIDYNARGQRLRIVYATDLQDGTPQSTETTYTYDPQTFRLARQVTQRLSDAARLQDFEYTYDPVGNLTTSDDRAQQTIFFANQAASPRADYTYDALYQIIQASGREHSGQTSPVDQTDPPVLSLPHPNNGAAMRRYTETYTYDEVGNLLRVRHTASGGNWQRACQYASNSNHLLAHSLPGDDLAGPYSAVFAYNAHGSMSQLPHLPVLSWDFKENMQQIELGDGGRLQFVYDASGQRVRKLYTHSGTTVEERIYLGGFEIYRKSVAGARRSEHETLHIMDNQQRIALVETLTVEDGAALSQPVNTRRYQLGNHLNSVCLELDAHGAVSTYEEYHPFGTTAYRAAGGIVTSPKRYRFSGKEKDEASGLYYHGARYYAPWLGRWTSADPQGLIDGNNVYRYVRNNPLRFYDGTGLFTETTDRKTIRTRGQMIEAFKTWEAKVDENHLAATPTEKVSLFVHDYNAKTSEQKLQGLSYYKHFGKYVAAGEGKRKTWFPIDLEHFMANAELGYYGSYLDVINSASFHLGRLEETYQAITPFAKDNAARTSAWSPEDIVSNYFGLLYGARLAEQPEGTSLAEFTERFFSDLDKAVAGDELADDTLISANDIEYLEYWLGMSMTEYAASLPQDAKNNKAHMARVADIQERWETESLSGWTWGGVVKFGYGLKDLSPAENLDKYEASAQDHLQKGQKLLMDSVESWKQWGAQYSPF